MNPMSLYLNLGLSRTVPPVSYPLSLLLCISPLSLSSVSSPPFLLCLFHSICSFLPLSLRLSYISPPMSLPSVSSTLSSPLFSHPSLLSVSSSPSVPLWLFPSVSFQPSLVFLYVPPLCLFPFGSSPLSLPLCLPLSLVCFSFNVSPFFLFPSISDYKQ
jgi:hypothetical protein